MRKKTSKRRWKARIKMGLWVPVFVVVDFGLSDLFCGRLVERDNQREFIRRVAP